MKLSEFRKKSNEYTAKASEIVRQLSLAGIAIVWLFHNTVLANNQPLLDKYLIIPLILLCSALLSDLLQYIIGGEIWIAFFRKKERQFKKANTDPEIGASPDLSKPIYLFYYLKMILMTAEM